MTFIYIVETLSGKLYTGVTNDLEQRMQQHKTGKGGAKFIKANGFKKLVYTEEVENKSIGMRREREIKRMSREYKNKLISTAKNIIYDG